MKKEKYAYLEGGLSIAANVLLFALKYFAGIMTASVALLADAWHTLSDSLSSFVILIAAKFSSKPPDSRHPFGHGRAELVGAIIVGIFLSLVGVNFLSAAVNNFIEQKSVTYGKIAVIVTLASILLKEALARFALWTWKRSGNSALKADAWHHRSDALSSLVILVGIFFGRFFWWIDSLLGVLLSLFVFHAAFEVLNEAIDSFMGEKPDENMVSCVKEIARDKGDDKISVHHMHVHRYGSHIELTFHILLPSDMSLKSAHLIATSIENAIRDDLGVESTIHMEPLR